METIIGEIAQKDLYVRIGDGLKIFERDIADFLAAEFFPRKKIKENTQVVDVIQAGERTRPLLNAAQKILTEVGKFLEKRVDLIQVFQIALTIVIGAVHRHVCHTDIIPQKKKYVNFTNSWARENQKNNRGKLQNEHSKKRELIIKRGETDSAATDGKKKAMRYLKSLNDGLKLGKTRRKKQLNENKARRGNRDNYS